MGDIISIIIPVYNAEKYIAACLDSILEQTYKDFEIICVDDGAKDRSGAICDEYGNRHSNIKVIHQQNGGVCVARNAGLDAATGSYIFFVDSDDSIPKNALEILYTRIKKYSADIVSGNVCHELGGGRSVPFFEIDEDVVSEGRENVLRRSPQYIYGSAAAKLYSRDAVKDIRFAEGRKINEDGFFVFECLLRCNKVVEINDTVYNYLYHNESVSHGEFSEKYYDILYFRDRKIEMLKEVFPEDKKLSNALFCRPSVAFLNLLNKAGYKKHKKEIKQIVKDIRIHSRPIGYLPKKEKIKLFLIKYCSWGYLKMMRRGSKNG